MIWTVWICIGILQGAGGQRGEPMPAGGFRSWYDNKLEPAPFAKLPSLLTNGGFEGGIAIVGKGWNYQGGTSNLLKVELDSKNFVEGNASAWINNQDPGLSMPILATQSLLAPALKPVLGRELSLSGCVKTEGANYAEISIEAFDAAGRSDREISLTKGGIRGSSSWKRFEIRFTLHPETVHLLLRCGIQGMGSAWFDDVRLVAVPFDQSKAASGAIDDFRDRLSRYVRARDGSEERNAREALEEYRSAPVEGWAAAAKKGFLHPERKPGSIERARFSGEGSGSYQVQIPKTGDSRAPRPLVVDLSAGFPDGKGGLTPIFGRGADFLIASLPLAPRVAGAAPDDLAARSDRKSLANIRDAIRDLRRNFPVDPDRVFVLGVRESARMALDFALAHRGEICGVVLVEPAEVLVRNLEANAVGLPVLLSAKRQAIEARETGNRTGSNFQAMGMLTTVKEWTPGQDPVEGWIGDFQSWAGSLRRPGSPEEFEEAVADFSGSYWVEALDRGRARNAAPSSMIRGKVLNSDRIVVVAQPGAALRVRIDANLIPKATSITILVNDEIRFERSFTPDFDFFLKDLRERGDTSRVAIAAIDL